jgi:diacylglycerol kinase
MDKSHKLHYSAMARIINSDDFLLKGLFKDIARERIMRILKFKVVIYISINQYFFMNLYNLLRVIFYNIICQF